MLPEHGEINDFEVWHDFPKLGERIVLINARRIAAEGDRPELILIAKEDVTERRRAEQHQDMLVGELSHRVKNTLAVVQSVATQTLRHSDTLEDFQKAFLGRIQALGRAHDMVLKSGFRAIPLDSIIEQALKPFQSNEQIEIAGGEAIELGQVASQSLTMILHEMATNAVKYGALSTPNGRVVVKARDETDGGVRGVIVTWTERGGPAPVRAKPGQGMRFIERSAAYELRGKARLAFPSEGFCAEIDFPLARSNGPDGRGEDPQGCVRRQCPA